MDNSPGLGGGFLSGPIIDLESPLHRHQSNHSTHSQLGLQHHMNVLNKGKGISTLAEANHSHNNMSEEDDPCYMDDLSGDNNNNNININSNNSDVSNSKKGSPWQRMKWTDEVVKLLIAIVSCVGDDGVIGTGEGLKRKSGFLHKKGKWKTVSKIMIGKGCHVSPQQCEDKFNDLNKRYKRLNEILGRGTSCRVVENPSLMDSMPNLSAKAKDDVKKILSSKHLFYKEMCAYHNGQRLPDCHDIDFQGCSLPMIGRCSKDNAGSEEDEEEEEPEPEPEPEENHHETDDEELDNEDNHGHFCESPEGSFEGEMAGVFADPTKSLWERREWVEKQAIRLEEQRVDFQGQALELERQRFRWLRYCKKKDRELERLRLENERMKLENERKVLHLRHRELELDLRRSEASLDHHHSIGVIDLGRSQ